MNFPHNDYRQAVRMAHEDSRSDVEAVILDFKADEKKKALLHLKLRFHGRVDIADFAEGGTAVQKNRNGTESFLSEIVTFDEVTGEVVVEVNRRSPDSRPDPNTILILNPPDFLRALDQFATGISINPRDNPETRFMQLADTVCGVPHCGPGRARREELRPSQNDAIEAALRNPFSFIWGPPGTGKSYTLGHLAAEWRKMGKKILVIAQTNSAVDVTTFAIDNACTARGEELADAELIRYTRRLTDIQEYKRRPHLMAFTRMLDALMKEESDARKRRDKLSSELARLPAGDEGRATLSLSIAKEELFIRSFGDKRKGEVSRLLEEATIVCATITSCLYGGLLERFRFDAVMVDEASFVPLAVWPWLLHPWRAGEEPQFAVAGDPMQLQPIFKDRNIPKTELNSVKEWFEKNIYAYLHIDSMSAAGSLMDAGTLVFLSEQFRMASGIRKAVSDAFYGGKLTGDGTDIFPGWPAGSGIPNGHVVAIDPKKCAPLPVAKRWEPVTGKLTNAASMDVTLQLVQWMIDYMESRPDLKLSVFVVAPFRNQANEYKKRLTGLKKPKNVELHASTVHTCQGREADVVVFDVVDAGHYSLIKPEAASLWCVACSRAKSQLIFVGDETTMRNGRFSRLMVKDIPFIGID